jgi:hypothetical protein
MAVAAMMQRGVVVGMIMKNAMMWMMMMMTEPMSGPHGLVTMAGAVTV